MSETGVVLDLILDWLNSTYARSFRIAQREGPAAVVADGSVRIAVEAHPLIETENAGWIATRDRLQSQIAAAVPAPVAIWVPAGADLPAVEPAISVLIDCVREVVSTMDVGERSQISLPIKLYLRKTAASGGLVSVSGGLNPYWARFTEHVHGTYDLDSTRLHRLPDAEEHLEQLIATIIERAASLQPGGWSEIETVDTWTVHRLHDGRGAVLLGVPPSDLADAGLAVRRNFRRVLSNAGPRLQARQADLRALAVIGPYARMEQEGATTALRGYDPALHSGIDIICLVADGLVKPLILPPAGSLPWNRR